MIEGNENQTKEHSTFVVMVFIFINVMTIQ